MKVVGIGHALLDYEYELPETWLAKLNIKHQDTILVETQEQNDKFKLLEHQKQSNISSGGALTNSLCAAKLYNQYCGNDQVEFISIGAVGDDANGALYREDLKRIGITSKHREISNMQTGNCLVLLTPPDARSMSTSLQASSHLTIDRETQQSCHDADILVIEGYLLTDENLTNQIIDLIQTVRSREEHNVKVMLTLASAFLVSNFLPNFAKLVSYSDLICGNTDEIKALTGLADINQALKTIEFDGIVLATDGENGAYFLEKNGAVSQLPAKAVPVENSLGAGDAFFGGILAMTCEGGEVTEAVKLGLQFGALAIQTNGPRLTKAGIESLDKS